MPLLDVSDLLSDPDFASTGLICERNAQIVGADGLAVNTTTFVEFTGVVTNDSGDILERIATGERLKGSILICTSFPLIDGASGFTADIVEWNGTRYTVASVNDYEHFGAGFVEASCELLPLAGGAP